MSALRDIHLPPDPAWWPPAPGWWLVALVSVGLAWRLALWLRARHRRSLPVRAALARFQALRERNRRGEPAQVLVTELAIVLRRAALSRFPRQRVAGLTGRAWLEFLNETGAGADIVSRAGTALASAPYHPRSTDWATDLDVDRLLSLAEGWVRRNAA